MGELKEKLFKNNKSGWENVDEEKRSKIEDVSSKYMSFLNKAKTEREFIAQAKIKAKENGYRDISEFDSLNVGTPNLHYKNLFEFGKFNLETENLITDRLNYQVLEPKKIDSKSNIINNTISTEVTDTNDNVETTSLNTDLSNSINNSYDISSAEALDYSKPQIYSDASNPITLEYMNLIKSNYLVSDIENPLVYNGSLLKRASIDLTSISGNITFKIHIKNILGENYVATVKIAIPLKDDVSGSIIYDGSFTKEITTKTFLEHSSIHGTENGFG